MAQLSEAFPSRELDSILEARYPCPNEPGGAIIVARGDSILYERYFGTADMATRRPVGPDTRFCIASVSKQFTVMALLQQAEKYDGSLLDKPASHFFKYPRKFWENITLRHLASHTSGLPDDRPRSDRHFCLFADEEQSIEYMSEVDSLLFGPGEYYDYLNPSFILLAKVTEQLSGEDFYSYVARNIFANAGMHSTYYFNRESDGAGQSRAYLLDDSGEWKKYDYGEETFFATRPDGGIYSTARDLLRWENALRDERIVSRETLQLAYTPLVNVTTSPFCSYQRRPDTWYGLGYFIEHPAGGDKKVYHTGDNGGYQAYLAKYPDDDIKIIVLENRSDRSRSELMGAIDRLLGKR